MKNLSYEDLDNLFVALSILYSDIEPHTLSERCIGAMDKIIPAEIIAFDFFTDKGVHTGKYWNNPEGAISESEYAIFTHVAHEHPFSPEVFGKNRFDEAMQTSDVLTTNQFHRTAIYNEFFKLCSIDYQLLAAFSDAPGSVITFNFSRTKSDFTEEERLKVNLIVRHLQVAFQNAAKLDRFSKTEARLNAVLESKSNGVIILNPENQIVYESEFARQMLEKYFAAANFGALPDSLNRWLKNEIGKFDEVGFSSPPQVLSVERKTGKLEISLMRNTETRETTVLLEEKHNPSAKLLAYLNLTKRETEILFWISQGKTNKDIGELLRISPRTVNKHTENIYIKLGVETRTAAASRALEWLQ